MINPLFWLGISLLLVAISLTAVLIVALPAVQELARAARSAEKLFDTLRREFPPTLEAIRLTGLEISELTDELNEGVKSASGVVKQVDDSISNARRQAHNAHVHTRSMFAGVKAAWKTLRRRPPRRRTPERLRTNTPSNLKSSSSPAFRHSLWQSSVQEYESNLTEANPKPDSLWISQELERPETQDI